MLYYTIDSDRFTTNEGGTNMMQQTAASTRNVKPASYFKVKTRKIVSYLPLYLMLLPGVLYYVIFRYGPMAGTLIAFKEFTFTKGILNSPWANPWYKHFVYFFKSPYFSQILSNTLLISVYKLFWMTLSSLGLAILINEVRNRFFKRFVQTVTYLPHFLSWVVIYGIIYSLFSESSGLVNILFRQAYNRTIPIMTSPEWFRFLLVTSEIWKDAGWAAIIYLAAIAGIDPTLYEAAYMDGAKRWQCIWHVTISGIRSTIVIVMILKLGSVLDAGFDQVYIMYNPNVMQVADIIDTWVYRTGLEQMNYSVATAVGLFKSVISVFLIMTVNKIAEKWGEGIW